MEVSTTNYGRMKMAKQTYTCVGMYEDNGQRWCESYEAESPEEAELTALRKAVERGEGDLLICGTFLGDMACVDENEFVRAAPEDGESASDYEG